MWTLGYWIHQRLEGVLFQPVATVLFWIGKQMQRHLAFNSTWYNLLPSSSTANMQNNHEVIFEWPHTEATTVVVTGTFDQWSSSIRLAKDSNGFKGSTQIPWDGKIAYKFIVDGQWTIAPSQPTETDSSGNVNNIYIAPSKPSPPTTTMSKTTEKPVANGDTPSSDKQETEASGGVSQVVSDLATAATAGTAAGLGYVASGVGAAIQTVVGEDPEKTTTEVPAPEPISKAVSEPTPVSAPPEPAVETLPEPAVEEALPEPTIVSEAEPPSAEPILPVVETPEHQAAPEPPKPVPEPTPLPLAEPAPAAPAVAPIVPIAIVPVNAAENNESPPPSAETKEEASTHSPSSFSSTPVPPAPAVVAAEVPPTPAEVSPAPVEVPAPAPAEPAVAPTSSDVIEDMKSTPETASEKPPTNGPAAEEDKPLSQPQLATPPPSAPSTPKKKEAFPSTESPSNSPSSSSKFGTSGSARKKRSSIFGKINIKHMFSPSKDKDKEKK
ncbi:hypothetical protein ARMSODRAFT_953293 [Armillaria solidipes]|uniref:AMP-activated protein kinase glycogen-binding domain-containing protein n=1 Tax=Armillaria solidipes TaxID=1076256 RepID=A0A2H3C0X9_9AGAR|nr:hypothetical protein ARMSODRAFT_953293 [Armillaria solidipes]